MSFLFPYFPKSIPTQLLNLMLLLKTLLYPFYAQSPAPNPLLRIQSFYILSPASLALTY